jgi:holo-[acyl-carrier protein] synthase
MDLNTTVDLNHEPESAKDMTDSPPDQPPATGHRPPATGPASGLTTGIDLIEISRIARAVERWGDRFARRVWTPDERAYCAGRIQSLAVRWAAKEAAAKALGVGLRGLGSPSSGVAWTDIEVGRDPSGRPWLLLHGAAAERAASLGIAEWSLSLSHSGGMAIALVVGLKH